MRFFETNAYLHTEVRNGMFFCATISFCFQQENLNKAMHIKQQLIEIFSFPIL